MEKDRILTMKRKPLKKVEGNSKGLDIVRSEGTMDGDNLAVVD